MVRSVEPNTPAVFLFVMPRMTSPNTCRSRGVNFRYPGVNDIRLGPHFASRSVKSEGALYRPEKITQRYRFSKKVLPVGLNGEHDDWDVDIVREKYDRQCAAKFA
jgi:hypothetical protein